MKQKDENGLVPTATLAPNFLLAFNACELCCTLSVYQRRPQRQPHKVESVELESVAKHVTPISSKSKKSRWWLIETEGGNRVQYSLVLQEKQKWYLRKSFGRKRKRDVEAVELKDGRFLMVKRILILQINGQINKNSTVVPWFERWSDNGEQTSQEKSHLQM